MRRFSDPFVCLMAVVAMGVCSSALADPSLDSKDRFQVKINLDDAMGEDKAVPKLAGIESGELTVELLRDHLDPNIFYYIPPQPRIGTIGSGESQVPEFFLMRYQLENDEGGIVNFSVRLGLSDKALTLLKEGLKSDAEKKLDEKIQKGKEIENALNEKIKTFPTGSGRSVRLTDLTAGLREHQKYQAELEKQKANYNFDAIQIKPITIANSVIDYQIPDTGKKRPPGAPDTVTGSSPTAQAGNSNVSQKMVTSLQLSRNATAIFDGLLFSTTGLACKYRITYSAITPPASFVVKYDWDKLNSEIGSSTSSSYAEGFSHSGWTEYISKNDVREELVKTLKDKGIMTIETLFDPKVVSDEFLQEMQKQALADLRAEIGIQGDNGEIKEAPKPGEGPVQFAKFNGRDSQTITNTSFKNNVSTKSGTSEKRFSARKRIERTDSFDGFIGIGAWVRRNKGWVDEKNGALSDKGKAELKTRGLLGYADDKGFDNLTFLLPSISPEVGIAAVDYTVQIVNEANKAVKVGSTDTWAAKWTEKDGWKKGAADIASISVPLGALEFFGADLKKLSVKSNATLTVDNKTVDLTPIYQSLGSGDMPGKSPLQYLRAVTIDIERMAEFFETNNLYFDPDKDVPVGRLADVTVFLRAPNGTTKQYTWQAVRNPATKTWGAPSDLSKKLNFIYDGAWGEYYEIAVKTNVFENQSKPDSARVRETQTTRWWPNTTTSEADIKYEKNANLKFSVNSESLPGK